MNGFRIDCVADLVDALLFVVALAVKYVSIRRCLGGFASVVSLKLATLASPYPGNTFLLYFRRTTFWAILPLWRLNNSLYEGRRWGVFPPLFPQLQAHHLPRGKLKVVTPEQTPRLFFLLLLCHCGTPISIGFHSCFWSRFGKHFSSRGEIF